MTLLLSASGMSLSNELSSVLLKAFHLVARCTLYLNVLLITSCGVLPWIRGSPTKKAQQTERRKGTSGHTQGSFSNDRTNQIITFHQWNLV